MTYTGLEFLLGMLGAALMSGAIFFELGREFRKDKREGKTQ